jgi:predicted RNA polymerase sigma factor
MEMTSEQVSRLQPLPEEEEENEEEEEEEEEEEDDDDNDDEILLSFKFVSIHHILNTFHEII